MYADLDCIPLRDWLPWLETAQTNHGGFCGFGSTADHVATSLMAARAGGLIITLAYEAATGTARYKRLLAWNDLASHAMTPAARGRESLCRIFPIEEVQPIGWWEQGCYFEEGEEFPVPDSWCLMLSNQQLGDRAWRMSPEELRCGRTRLAYYLRESRRRAEAASLASFHPEAPAVNITLAKDARVTLPAKVSGIDTRTPLPGNFAA